MKKVLNYALLAVSALFFATSCSEDIVEPVVSAPEVAGVWNVKMDDPAYINVDFGNEMLEESFTPMLGMLPQMLKDELESLTLTFTEDDKFSVSWQEKGETEVGGLPSFIALDYEQESNTVNLLMSKLVFELGMEMLVVAGHPESIKEDIKAVLVDKGDSYALPLQMKDANGVRTFYLTKETVIPAVTVIMAMMGDEIPEEMLGTVDIILAALQTAPVLDLGVNATR